MTAADPLSALPAPLREGLVRYAETATRIAGDRLVSLAVFGAALTPDWHPPRPVHHAIVTTGTDLALTAELGLGLRRTAVKLGLAAPLLLTPELIRSSLDTYPLEWLDIGACHAVLVGTDPFADLACEREAVRVQCEREGTALAMALRQRVLTAGKRRIALDDLADQAVRVARGVVHLGGGAPERAPSAVLAATGRLLGRDLQPIVRAWNGESGDELTGLLHEAFSALGAYGDRA